MRKYLGLYSLFLLCTLSALPQGEKKNKAVEKPNLSGRWLLDRKKSNVGSASHPDLPLEITHLEPEIRIIRRYEWNGEIKVQDSTYYSDDRGETNPATMFLGSDTSTSDMRALEGQKTSSRTSWSRDRLVTKSLIRSRLRGRMLQLDVIDEWKLSDDKNTLTRTTRNIAVGDAVLIPRTQPDSKRVYQRIPG